MRNTTVIAFVITAAVLVSIGSYYLGLRDGWDASDRMKEQALIDAHTVSANATASTPGPPSSES